MLVPHHDRFHRVGDDLYTNVTISLEVSRTILKCFGDHYLSITCAMLSEYFCVLYNLYYY